MIDLSIDRPHSRVSSRHITLEHCVVLLEEDMHWGWIGGSARSTRLDTTDRSADENGPRFNQALPFTTHHPSPLSSPSRVGSDSGGNQWHDFDDFTIHIDGMYCSCHPEGRQSTHIGPFWLRSSLRLKKQRPALFVDRRKESNEAPPASSRAHAKPKRKRDDHRGTEVDLYYGLLCFV